MKPCCSLLTPLPPGEARTLILNLQPQEGTGPRVQPLAGKDSLRIRWESGSQGRPLLGFPVWQLDFSSGSLGTVVDFRWIFPWKRTLLILLAAAAPGVFLYTLFPWSVLGLPFMLLGGIFFAVTAAGHLSTKQGKSWKALKALVKETVQGC